MYNEMQGVSNCFRKIKNRKKVKVHNYTYYAKHIAVFLLFLFLFPIIFRVYNSFFEILITRVSPFIITFLMFYLLLFYLGYYYTKKQLDGEVHFSVKGIKIVDDTGFSLYAPWKLVDFVYVGEYGIYIFIKRHLITFVHKKHQEEIMNYLEEEQIDVFIYRKED